MAPSPPRLRILSGTLALPPSPFVPLHKATALRFPYVQGMVSTEEPLLVAPLMLKFFVVGGNATSAFLSWRLQATNACDVTLVWKSGYDAVSQYGISFK